MSKAKKDSLGDRMKSLEACSEATFPAQLPVVLRLDGKAFHTLTKKLKLKKPLDESFHLVMTKVAVKLCETVQNTRFAYTQSDEISLLLYPKTVLAQPWFRNRIQKVVSVAAGTASSYITWLLQDQLKEHCSDRDTGDFTVYPCFDARAFIIFRQKTPTQLVGWGMNGAGFEHIVLQPLMRLLHNCQHSSFCSKSFLWKGIDPN